MADREFIKIKKRDIRIMDCAGLEELAEHGKNIDQ
jgi:hypothetical protein